MEISIDMTGLPRVKDSELVLRLTSEAVLRRDTDVVED